MEKIVLAYSGGLDTSVILKWLIDRGYEVIAYIADIGQNEDFNLAREKALKIGAKKVYIEDLKKEFVTDYIFPMFKANALYEGNYLLGTSIARPLIAKRQIEIAQLENAYYVAHGATGKGNDQVRFELSYYALNPFIKVIAPWKMSEFLEQFKGRTDLINYANKKGIEIKSTISKPYSEDENLLHISHEAGILEDPSTVPTDEILSRVRPIELTPNQAAFINLEFKDGIPTKVVNQKTGEIHTEPLSLFQYLNKIGEEHGVGVIDMVENRFVGIKSRGIYETPGGTILFKAHLDIEGIAMDREVRRLRDMLSAKYAELVYNGFWFSPEMEFLKAAIDKSQELIDGEVKLKIFKGNVLILGRTSPSSLYDEKLSSMDQEGGFNQKDSEGFIKVNAIRLKAHAMITKKQIQKRSI
jgi:argininosuccinate synthase